jgi:hypothetical protein
VGNDLTAMKREIPGRGMFFDFLASSDNSSWQQMRTSCGAGRGRYLMFMVTS